MASIISRLSFEAYKLAPSPAKRIGPHGETLAAVACGAAIALPLFAPRDWWGFQQYLPGASLLILVTLLLLLSAYFLLAAVAHAERTSRKQRRVLKVEQFTCGRKKYQVTPTRVLVLKAAGVPRDITGVLQEMFKGLAAGGNGQVLPPSPLQKEQFIEWLSREVGLGRTRVEEFREVILRYAECDPDEQGQPAPLPAAPHAVPDATSAVGG